METLTTAREAYDKAQSDFFAAKDERNQARRAKWEADEALDAAEMKVNRLLISFDEARRALTDAAFLAR